MLKEMGKEKLSVSRMPRKEAHYLWLLNDKSRNWFAFTRDKRLVLTVIFDFSGLKLKPSLWACNLSYKLLAQFIAF